MSQRSGANQSGGRCQIAWGTKQTTGKPPPFGRVHTTNIRSERDQRIHQVVANKRLEAQKVVARSLTGGGRLLDVPTVDCDRESGRWGGRTWR